MTAITQVKNNERRRARMASCPDMRARNYLRKKEWVKNNPEKWRALEKARHIKEPFLKLIMKSRIRAKDSGIPNDLTIEWARKRWTGRCEITGAEFKYMRNGKQNAFSPSLDKIDPSKGYVQNNCRFILCALNRFKGDEGDNVMMEIARLLLGH